MLIAVFGASGSIGRPLVPVLTQAGHDVRVVGRRPGALPSGAHIEQVVADAADQVAVRAALEGVDIAYYLVHSMAGPDFEQMDAMIARTFAEAASDAGVRTIVYLGGLGEGATSRHLVSRQQVGELLASTGVNVVTLRAAVILGAGSISFEMLRYLVERLPFMVCPRWVHTRIEPIALADVLRYLLRAMDVPGGEYEIGCGEVTSYRGLMDRYTDARGLPRRLVVDVPFLTLRLSSYWVDFVTPVDRRVSHALIESLASEVVVNDRVRADAAFGIAPMSIDEAMRRALDDQLVEISADIQDRGRGLRDGVYSVRTERAVPSGRLAGASAHLAKIGGDLDWYGIKKWWRLRLAIGNMLGEHNDVQRPSAIVERAHVDWWIVEHVDERQLVLRSVGWRFGEGWLAYRVSDTELIQTAAFRSKGILGFAYWNLLRPVHAAAFRAMADHFHDRIMERSDP